MRLAEKLDWKGLMAYLAAWDIVVRSPIMKLCPLLDPIICPNTSSCVVLGPICVPYWLPFNIQFKPVCDLHYKNV